MLPRDGGKQLYLNLLSIYQTSWRNVQDDNLVYTRRSKLESNSYTKILKNKNCNGNRSVSCMTFNTGSSQITHPTSVLLGLPSNRRFLQLQRSHLKRLRVTLPPVTHINYNTRHTAVSYEHNTFSTYEIFKAMSKTMSVFRFVNDY